LKIRLLAEARGSYRKKFLDDMRKIDPDISVDLHFGDKNSDFDVPSLMRQEIKVALSGRLFDKEISNLPSLSLITNRDYESNLSRFIDQMHRASKKFVGRSHRMISIHEYIDYYHILASAIADKIIEKNITHVLFFDIPHLGIDTVIYDVAVALELKIIILSQQFPNGVFSCSRIEDVGKINFDFMPEDQISEKSANTDMWYMKPEWQTKTKNGKIGLQEIFNFYAYFLRRQPTKLFDFRYQRNLLSVLSRTLNAFPYWRSPFNKFFNFDWLAYLINLENAQSTDINFDQNYVYVPLHLQPEMTTSALGSIYRDQLLMLEKLSAILPSGWKILVKENPKQGPFARDPMFFQRFARIPNLIMVCAESNSLDLIKHSKMVATVTGTAALEAAENGKPAVVFGNAWFRRIHGIFEFDPHIDIQTISLAEIDTNLVKKQQRYLIDRLHYINIDKGFFEQVANFDEDDNSQKVGRLICDILTGREDLLFSE